MNSTGGVDINSSTFTLDGSTVSIDSTDTTNLTMTANNASNKTLTISAINNGSGNANIDIDADGDIDIDALGNITIDVPVNKDILIGNAAVAADIKLGNVMRFLTFDIVPAPLRGSSLFDVSSWVDLLNWMQALITSQAFPGIISTIVLTQIALVGTAFLSLALFPLISNKFFGKYGRMLGHLFLVVVRSTPEFILAYIFLQFWGPSMLPAIVALSLHNGAIIGHLMGRYSNEISLRPDHAHAINLYGYEIIPRIYGQFLAFLFYRWEVIMRETAILGILGIATLGFYVDSALADIRLDRAIFLIVITAFLNVGIDSLSRYIRQRLRLSRTVQHHPN